MLRWHDLTRLDIYPPAGMNLGKCGLEVLNLLRERLNLELQILGFQLFELIQRRGLLGLWRLLCGRRNLRRGWGRLRGYGRHKGGCWGCGLLGLNEGCG